MKLLEELLPLIQDILYSRWLTNNGPYVQNFESLKYYEKFVTYSRIKREIRSIRGGNTFD